MSQLPYTCSPTICPLVKRTMSRQICGTGTFSSWPITQTLSQRRSGRSLKMPSWPLTCSWGGRSLTIKKNAYSGSSTHASSWISVEGDSLRPLSVSMSTWRVEWMTVFNHLLRHDYCQSYTSVTAGLYLYLYRNI